MRSTDYISKGTAVARLYKAREYLLMDKDCRKGLCFLPKVSRYPGLPRRDWDMEFRYLQYRSSMGL